MHKKWILSIICLSLCVFQKTDRVFANLLTGQDLAYPSSMNIIVRTLRAIRHLPAYQVDYQLMDQTNNIPIFEGQALVNQKESQLELKLEFFDAPIGVVSQDDPKTALKYHLLAYDNLSRVYLNFEDYFSQFPDSDRIDIDPEVLSNFRNTFIEVDQVKKDATLSILELTDSIMVLPQEDLLFNFRPEQVSLTDSDLLVRSSRLGIPFDILDFQQSLSFQHSIQLALSPNNLSGDRLDFHSELHWKNHQDVLEWQLNQKDSKENASLMGQNKDPSFIFTTGQVTDKLTQYYFKINPNNLTYDAELVGLVEDFDLNIFSHQTAKYRASNYQLRVQVRPVSFQLLAEGDLNLVDIDTINDWMNK